MAPKIGQRWLYQSKDKIDRFICEILPDERYIIVQYGTEVDYVDRGISGSGFKFTNPNITSTCGCGSSFSV